MKLKTGDRFPQFTFDTHLRDDLSSVDVLNGKTVFWVLRYIGCTVCRYDVHLIAQRYQEFKEKGAQVFVVMQSDKKHVTDDLSKGDVKLPFEIIIDPKQKIYEQVSNTLYEIETDYEGIHSLPSIWNKYLLEEDNG